MQVLLERRDNQNGCVDLGQAIHHWSYDIMGDLTFGGANRLVGGLTTQVFFLFACGSDE